MLECIEAALDIGDGAVQVGRLGLRFEVGDGGFVDPGVGQGRFDHASWGLVGPERHERLVRGRPRVRAT